MLSIKITNEKKFNKIDEIEFTGKSIYNNSFNGNVFIQLKNGNEISLDGEHSVNDWKDDYGFVVTEE